MPDICLSTAGFHTPREVVEWFKAAFLREGYAVGVNAPFAGCLVPMEYYQRDTRVQVLMIEVNRIAYMKKDSCLKSEKEFVALKSRLHALSSLYKLKF
jgi:N-formylglutamate deformylase